MGVCKKDLGAESVGLARSGEEGVMFLDYASCVVRAPVNEIGDTEEAAGGNARVKSGFEITFSHILVRFLGSGNAYSRRESLRLKIKLGM